MPRSGLIIEVPEAEVAVGKWRRELDPLARFGVPAHITVLFPFAEANGIDDAMLAALISLASRVPAFRFRLSGTGWFEQRVLWLAPDPSAAFVELTELAARTFPDYPPYGGQFSEVVPHLTVGDRGEPGRMAAAQRSLKSALPISSTARAITLMTEQPDRGWQVRATFPFAGP